MERREDQRMEDIRRVDREEIEKMFKIIKPLDVVAMKDYIQEMVKYIKKYEKREYIVNYLQRVNELKKYYPCENIYPDTSKLEKLILEAADKSDENHVRMFFLKIKDSDKYIYPTCILSDNIVDILYNCFKTITDLERIT